MNFHPILDLVYLKLFRIRCDSKNVTQIIKPTPIK